MRMVDNKEIKKICEQRYGQMREYTLPWEAQWRQLRDYIYPFIGRFEGEQENKGERTDNEILHGAAGLALRTLVSGFQSGITSPSRPWLRLVLADTELSEFPRVREWLDRSRDVLLSHYRTSNFYGMTQSVYRECAVFGTANTICNEDPKSVFRFRAMTCGEYMLDVDNTQRLNCMARKFSDRAFNLVSMFGLDNLPLSVVDAYKNNDTKSKFEVRQLIFENTFLDKNFFGWRGKPYISVYWMADSKTGSPGGSDSGILQVTGFDELPFAAPRWGVIGGDIYGKGSPGWEALGDCKQLQQEVDSKLTQLDILVRPPLNMPEGLRGGNVLPGGAITVPRDAEKGAWPMYQVTPQLNELRLDINDVKMMIEETFFKPLFLAVIMGSDRQQTAREVVEKHEEKLMMISPALDSMHNEFLSPLITRDFNILMRRELLPPPPDELLDSDIQVEYIGIFAQAQKMIETQKTQETLMFASSFAQFNPEILDKINFDKALDVYADGIGASPGIVRDENEVAEIRQARAQQQQAELERTQAEQMAAQTLPRAAQGVKTLSEVDTSGAGNNALMDVVNSLGGSIV